MKPGFQQDSSDPWPHLIETCMVLFFGWGLVLFLESPLFVALDGLPFLLQVAFFLGFPTVCCIFIAVLWWSLIRPGIGAMLRWLGVRPQAEKWSTDMRIFLLVCVVMTLISLLPMGHSLQELRYHRWLGSFQPVDAVVTGTRIDEVEGGRNGTSKGLAPRVLYKYQTNGTQYEGYKIHWELLLPGPPEAAGPPPISSVIWERSVTAHHRLESYLSRYSVGSRLTAYVDPNNPENACLKFVPFEPISQGGGMWFGLFVLTIVWTIFGISWYVMRRRQLTS